MGAASDPMQVVVRPMSEEDIEQVRTVGQRTWSDVASKDAGRKVRYPFRPREIIEAYRWKDPQGCLVAEENGVVVGSAFSHVWGGTGWIGPFEVLPEKQGHGIGTSLMQASESYLAKAGCGVMGLETMPYFLRNVHFYLRFGYTPKEMTFIMSGKELARESQECVRRLEIEDLGHCRERILELSRSMHPSLDLTNEVEMALNKKIGKCLVFEKRGRIGGLAVVHDFYPADADHASLRLMLVDSQSRFQKKIFEALLSACEHLVKEERRKRLFVRFSSTQSRVYPLLHERSYVLEGANIRMVKGRYAEKEGYSFAAWAG